MTSTCCATGTSLRTFVLGKRLWGQNSKRFHQVFVPELGWCRNPAAPCSRLPFPLLFLPCLLSLAKDHQAVNDHNVVYNFVRNYIYQEKMMGGEWWWRVTSNWMWVKEKRSRVSVPLGNLFHFIYPSLIADASISWSTCNPVKYLVKITRPLQDGNSWQPPPFHLSQGQAGPDVCCLNRICGSVKLNLLRSNCMFEGKICCQAISKKLRIYNLWEA